MMIRMRLTGRLPQERRRALEDEIRWLQAQRRRLSTDSPSAAAERAAVLLKRQKETEMLRRAVQHQQMRVVRAEAALSGLSVRPRSGVSCLVVERSGSLTAVVSIVVTLCLVSLGMVDRHVRSVRKVHSPRCGLGRPRCDADAAQARYPA